MMLQYVYEIKYIRSWGKGQKLGMAECLCWMCAVSDSEGVIVSLISYEELTKKKNK
ncbi:hypothetical protein [Photobacterium sp. J15]|uniref:hypothetical protein n=1 Tax=Photobacterium sp. J15 TaxID=265901 RepID=UPI000B2EDCE5|nr:hypothetical protein [Photobacterium sp. J15]